MDYQEFSGKKESGKRGIKYSLWVPLILTFVFFVSTVVLVYGTVDYGAQISANAEKIGKLTSVSNVLLGVERKLSVILITPAVSASSETGVTREDFRNAVDVLKKEWSASNQRGLDSLGLLLEGTIFSNGFSPRDSSVANNAVSALLLCRQLSGDIVNAVSLIRRDQGKISVILDKYWFILSGIAIISTLFALSTVISFYRYRVNVNRRKAAEEELFKQQETYRNLVESMNEGLIITDLEDCIIFANPAIEKLTGYKPHQLTGRIFHKTFTNSSEWPEFQSRMEKRILGEREQYTKRLIKHDGTLAEVHINATPFRNPEGEITGTLGVVSDLSERAFLEEQIAVQRNNLIAVIENTDNYIWAFTHDFKLLVFNSSFSKEYENLFGVVPYPGMPVLDFVPPQLRRAWRMIAKKALTGSVIRMDFPYILEGLPRAYRVALNPIKSETGEVTGVVAFMQDITQMRAAEEELRAAKETAEEATKQKTVFLANMSHEIRTPLNGILGMANLMEESELTSEQRLYTTSIKESGALLLSLINEILDISKVEAGKIELVEDEFELLTMLESINDMFTVQAENKGISFYIDLHRDVPLTITGDSMRLQQILINCLSNAFKFTAKGYVELSIGVERIDDEKYLYSFRILDSGKGMNEETRASIFEEYYQGNSDTSKIYGGTGLGLSIARNFTRLMGGEISVDSVENKGSVFTVNIPLKAAKPADSADQISLSGEILLVSNNNRGTEITENLLREAGFTPVTVYNAANAIVQMNKARTNGKKFAAVINNFNLPGYDGFELCKQIIDLVPEHPPLFLLIGRKKAVHIRRQLSKQPVHILSKPFYRSSIAELIAVLVPKSVEVKEKPAEENQNKLRVLIADDNKINLTVLSGFLRKLGHYVHQVRDGNEAVEEYKSGEFDIILMDCNMPTVSGFDATKMIRQLEEGTEERMPIIGVTAYNGKTEKDRCLASGMDDMLSKPFDIAELRRMLELHTVSSSIREYSDSGFTVENERVVRLRESLDSETIDELLELFLNDFQGYLASVSERITQHNFAGLSEQSHTIKSACANLGADKLWKYVEKLEHECNSLPAEEITLLFNKIADEFIYVKEKIRIYLADRT